MWNRVDVLQWWKDSGLELVYSHGAIELAVIHGGLEVLRWWRDSGLEVKLDSDTLRWAIKKGKTDVLTIWLESGWELFQSWSQMMQVAESSRHPDVVQWAIEIKSSWEATWGSTIGRGWM
ncbi:hypothetical protein DFJ73DRAFT_881121, partial [Zopfochytrium polystomum]